MLFSSIIFIFYFLPVFLLGYYASGWRTGALLVGSVAFYVWGEWAYIALLGGLILINWGGALWLGRVEALGPRRAGLISLIVLDLGVLGIFKYADFIIGNLNALGLSLPKTGLELPLGISFFTFQLISYVADVHLRRAPAERDLTKFSAYILMFPHLIAGPIVRYADIRDEMHADRRKSGKIGLGLQYFIVGLCQKTLIANTVAPLADYAFGLPAGDLDAITAWVGAGAYTLQIYFDFCGYSNMAIGLAFMMGFTYPKNFDHPYASQSITEFWRRWHMSLSSWFRDYVYIPLGGNRGGQAKTVRNLLIVFLLTGVWHGASWTFILWGLYHGGFLLIERFGLARSLTQAWKPVRHLYAVVVVLLGWVLFRAETLPVAIHYYASMFGAGGVTPKGIALVEELNAEVMAALVLGIAFSGPTLGRLMTRLKAPLLPPSGHLEARLDTQGVHILPTAILICGLIVSCARLAGSSLNPFLYFRF